MTPGAKTALEVIAFVRAKVQEHKTSHELFNANPLDPFRKYFWRSTIPEEECDKTLKDLDEAKEWLEDGCR